MYILCKACIMLSTALFSLYFFTYNISAVGHYSAGNYSAGSYSAELTAPGIYSAGNLQRREVTAPRTYSAEITAPGSYSAETLHCHIDI